MLRSELRRTSGLNKLALILTDGAWLMAFGICHAALVTFALIRKGTEFMKTRQSMLRSKLRRTSGLNKLALIFKSARSGVRALPVLLLICLSTFNFQLSTHAALVTFALTDSGTGLPYTNVFTITAISQVVNADGSYNLRGLPARVTPSANGCATNYCVANNYLAQGPGGFQLAYQSPDNTSNLIAASDWQISGGNYFVTRTVTYYGTNTINITNNTVLYTTNFGYTTNTINITNNLSVPNYPVVTNAVPTNGLTVISGQTLFYSTNYDAFGAAGAVQAYASGVSNLEYALNGFVTNATSSLSNQLSTVVTASGVQIYATGVSNNVVTTSNALAAATAAVQTYGTGVSNNVVTEHSYAVGVSNLTVTAQGTANARVSMNGGTLTNGVVFGTFSLGSNGTTYTISPTILGVSGATGGGNGTYITNSSSGNYTNCANPLLTIYMSGSTVLLATNGGTLYTAPGFASTSWSGAGAPSESHYGYILNGNGEVRQGGNWDTNTMSQMNALFVIGNNNLLSASNVLQGQIVGGSVTGAQLAAGTNAAIAQARSDISATNTATLVTVAGNLNSASNVLAIATAAVQTYGTGVSNNVVTEHTYAVGVSNNVVVSSNAAVTLVNSASNVLAAATAAVQTYGTGVSNNVVTEHSYAVGVSNNVVTSSNAALSQLNSASNVLAIATAAVQTYSTSVSNNVVTSSNALAAATAGVQTFATSASNYDKSVYLPITNGVVQGGLSLGGNLAFSIFTNVISIKGGPNAGDYWWSAAAGVFTNRIPGNGCYYTNNGSANILFNAANSALDSSPTLTGTNWTLLSGGAAPTNAVYGYAFNLDGIPLLGGLDSTNIATTTGTYLGMTVGSATNAINNNNGVGTNLTVYGTLTSTNLNALYDTNNAGIAAALVATNNFGRTVAVNMTNTANSFTGNGGGLTNCSQTFLTNIVSGQPATNRGTLSATWRVPVVVSAPATTVGFAEVDAQVQSPGGSYVTIDNASIAGGATSILATNKGTLVFEVPPGWGYVVTNSVSGTGYAAGLNAGATNQVTYHP
jgi:hypothetical protein